MVQDACDALVITQTLIKILEATFFSQKVHMSRREQKKKKKDLSSVVSFMSQEGGSCVLV